MRQNLKIKLSVDAFMTLALFLLMGFHFWGDKLHEWLGLGMFILFIAHHILNSSWHKNIFKGKYNTVRTLTLVIDILVLISMLFQMYSSIVISRYAFAFLPSSGNVALARKLHILGAYWGFILMGLHLGLHWNMILKAMRKKEGSIFKTKKQGTVAFVVCLSTACYGIWVFIKRDFLNYLFLRTEYVFMDYRESKLLFYFDYFAVMVLCIFIAHYGLKILRKFKKNRRKNNGISDIK